MRNLGSIELETKRLFLRHFVVEDAKAMFENWASDSENVRYVTWDPHPNPQVTQASIERWLLHYQEENTYKWAICKKEDPKQVIGNISVVSQDPQKEICEVGYILGKNFWGQGIMTEALKAVLHFLLLEVGFKEVQAKYVSLNPASGRVMEKAGMHYLTTLPNAVARKGYIGDQITYTIHSSNL
ncbi:GNAT family N-acetyltransferase [Streptococcus lactarius]|uniref:GNAT family N-acetyltransferase n=1 Tax=Streptococcus lactarius TaxID=684066 RepID=A0A9X0WPE2_9STRE|nr:GNAT family N-acetyltransferase [Streptococcus lactarius]MBK4780007.1 GNAT family N-acetyltransferase [Streptococcus lactarius]QUB39352.1 GNAT family N-acetyltransferase [Streptococcus lactarius]